MFEDFVRHFNKLYICRVFSEDFFQYAIKGAWAGVTAAGQHKARAVVGNGESWWLVVGGWWIVLLPDFPPRVLAWCALTVTSCVLRVPQVMADIDEEKVTEKSAKHIVARDGDPNWFNNPQFVRT